MKKSPTETIPGREELLAARARLSPFVHYTPVMTCTAIDRIVNARIWFKCENFQKVGAFKIRGAMNALRSLHPERLKNGVCTHSSGNHAQAVALAARALEAPAYIVMPSNSPEVKQKAVAGYGAEIRLCAPTLAAREAAAEAVMAETGALFLHPYDDYAIIAGQSTAAQELLEVLHDPDVLMAPVGGGGLISGTALAARSFSPGTRVVAAEPAGADDCYRSIRDGVRYPSENPRTIADGLLTSVGERNLEIIRRHVDEVVTCSEEAIVRAMRLIWERMKIIVEPSSAVPLACLLEEKVDVKGKRVGIILSGGNVDLGRLPF